ncbi:macrophage mannose receptor 1-like [Plectropomus leopardus]|uniref:macrophage mannose receptor 1-like n=1 Tax=Plectropomus leopardus TaxID=160734 RepID=UPI001C4C522B|nr:macrophage mannose receptor 1-like [Plectropomus leopardus]
MKDMNSLTNSFNLSEHQQLAWIGLYDDVDSWRWSLSDTSFYGHGETEFRRWGNRQPDNQDSGEYCTEMWADGYWNDAPCDVRRKVVCCDVTGSNVTFVFINTTMNWTEAQSYCRQHHTDLASVRNLAENQQVQQLMTAAGESDVWIGLFRDSWKWSDGGNSSFRYWRQSQPDNRESKEFCVAANFNQSGNWEDWNCDYKRAFICYSKPEPPKPTTTKQVFRLRLSKEDSSLDLNDPAVAESLLKQIKQKLKDQGLSDDVRLSWRKQPGGKIFHKEEKKKTTEDEL